MKIREKVTVLYDGFDKEYKEQNMREQRELQIKTMYGWERISADYTYIDTTKFNKKD